MGPRIIASSKAYVKSQVSIQRLLYDNLKKHGDNIHCIEYETGKTTTFNQLFNESLKLGAALIKLGLKPGDVIIVYGFNSYEFLVAFVATLFAGGTVMSMRALDSDLEVKNTLLFREAKFMFVTAEKRETAEFVSVKLPEFKNIILFERSADPKYQTLNELVQNSNPLSDQDIYEPKDENETVLIIESSGTSGAMKAIMLGHFDLATIYHPVNNIPPNDSDVYSGNSPLAHLSGLAGFMRPMIYGKKIVVFRGTTVDKLIDGIEKYRISILVLSPSMVNLIMKVEKKPDLSSLRKVFVAGSRVSPKLMVDFNEKFPMEVFRNVYTMTEITAMALIADKESDFASGGKIAPGVKAKVINPETGEILGENETGEICIKGPFLFRGYHKNEDATREILDSDGWIHTGDIGYFDDKEIFYIVDRIKDIITQDGYGYSPVDVEETILEHEAVKEAAVVGIPYGLDLDVSHAFVVLRDEFRGKIKEEDLLSFTNNRTSKLRQIKGGVHFVSEIPKTDFGKIVRRKLRDQFLNNMNTV